MERPRRVWMIIGCLAIAAALAALMGTASGCKKPSTSTGTTETSGTVSTPATSTAGNLDPAQLPQMQEGLLFSYVQAGGMPALEKAFGKPTGRYMTYAAGTPGGSLELPDGRSYRFEWGFDEAGKAIVMGHTIEGTVGQSPTAKDKAFVAALTDGESTLDDGNRYLQSVGGKAAKPATIDPKAIKVPASLWKLKDGTGFIVVDLTRLTVEQMKSIDMEDQGPYQAMYWDATHFRAY